MNKRTLIILIVAIVIIGVAITLGQYMGLFNMEHYFPKSVEIITIR